MRRTLLVWVAIFCADTCLAQASESEPFARATLSKNGERVVGEPVTLQVEVLVPTFFAGAPRYPDLDLENALTLFNDSGTNFTEQIGSTTFAGQSRSYTIYAQRAGTFDVPSLLCNIRYRGKDGLTDTTVATGTLQFRARVPPEAASWPYFMATTAFDLRQELDPAPVMLHVGDAFSRTITASAVNLPSMVIPPLHTGPVQGFGIHPSAPSLDDSGTARGARLTGTRVETVTYIAESPGDYWLPAIEIRWWDLANSEARVASLPPLKIEVAAAVVPENAAPFQPQESMAAQASGTSESVPGSLRKSVAPVLLVVILVTLLYLAARGYAGRFRAWRSAFAARRSDSADACLSRFAHAARNNDAAGSWRWLTASLDRTRPSPAIVREFSQVDGDASLREEIGRLQQHLFGNPQAREDAQGWSGRPLLAAVQRASRSTPRRLQGHHQEPELNLNPR